jgi:hypothetical protein
MPGARLRFLLPSPARPALAAPTGPWIVFQDAHSDDLSFLLQLAPWVFSTLPVPLKPAALTPNTAESQSRDPEVRLQIFLVQYVQHILPFEY